MKGEVITKFRVWHIPQVPGKAFHVETKSYAEAVRLHNALADYDQFQFDNRIKPDYCNAGGIQFFDHNLTPEDLQGMELDDAWVGIDDLASMLEYYQELAGVTVVRHREIPETAVSAALGAYFSDEFPVATPIDSMRAALHAALNNMVETEAD